MKVYDSVIDAIGNTPIVRLRRFSEASGVNFFAKLEFMNPGGSVKDRMVRHMFSEMERFGLFEHNDVIIESSSGNTGAALSMACAVRGLRCIISVPDKMSKEKLDRMRAFRTELIVAPGNVSPDDPKHYCNAAKSLSIETPGSIFPDQYNNPLNAEAHYLDTGPELWEQMNGEIDVFVCGIGTGGTLSGVGKYLKEKNRDIRIIGVDAIGSVFYDYFYNGTSPVAIGYQVEGIGKDQLIDAIDFSVIDEIVQVGDRESFAQARRLVSEEGILAGGSSGSAVAAAMKIAHGYPGKNILILLPDSGNMYLSKVFNDEWMHEQGFFPDVEG